MSSPTFDASEKPSGTFWVRLHVELSACQASRFHHLSCINTLRVTFKSVQVTSRLACVYGKKESSCQNTKHQNEELICAKGHALVLLKVQVRYRNTSGHVALATVSRSPNGSAMIACFIVYIAFHAPQYFEAFDRYSEFLHSSLVALLCPCCSQSREYHTILSITYVSQQRIMSSWLGRQRKPELIALAERAGLDEYDYLTCRDRDPSQLSFGRAPSMTDTLCFSLDGLRKDELVAVLDEHLTKNASRLRSSSVFKDYYGRTSSPVKRDSGAEPKSTRRRRATSVKEETDL